ncbi:MAG: hypothetical protein AB1847_13235 [bacterium]
MDEDRFLFLAAGQALLAGPVCSFYTRFLFYHGNYPYLPISLFSESYLPVSLFFQK